MDLSAETPASESISGRTSSKKALKSIGFSREGYEKVPQNVAPERHPSHQVLQNTPKMRKMEQARHASGSGAIGHCSDRTFSSVALSVIGAIGHGMLVARVVEGPSFLIHELRNTFASLLVWSQLRFRSAAI